MIGALIGGIASVAGALIGSKKQKTVSRSKVNYQKMVKKAEKAGFNPLTVLRNGGSAAFASTTTIQHPGLSGVGEAVAQMGGAIGREIEIANDPMTQKRNMAESLLLDYQLKALQSGNMKTPRFGDVPQVVAPTTQKVSPMLSAKDEPAAFVPLNATLEAKASKATQVNVGGVDLNPGALPDGQDIEDWLGEAAPVTWGYAAAKIAEAGMYGLYRAGKAARDFLADDSIYDPAFVAPKMARPTQGYKAQHLKGKPSAVKPYGGGW